MKQNIIIKVAMHCSKCRKKALQIAAVACGVTSVAFHGAEKDKLKIVGEGVNVACLTNALRKKLCHASIEIVEEVKENQPPKPPSPEPVPIICCPQPPVEIYRVVPDPTPLPCTIL